MKLRNLRFYEWTNGDSNSSIRKFESRLFRKPHDQFDARGRVVPGRDGELEAGAIEDARGNRDLQRVPQQLGSAAVAPRAWRRPRFAAPSASAAGASDGHFERNGRSTNRLTRRQPDR